MLHNFPAPHHLLHPFFAKAQANQCSPLGEERVTERESTERYSSNPCSNIPRSRVTMRPTTHTVTSTNPASMHWEHRAHHISSTYILDNGRSSINVNFVSKLAVDDPNFVDYAVIFFRLEEKAQLAGAPPQVRNPQELSPPFRGTWVESLTGFVYPSSTEAWEVMMERVHATTRLPMAVRRTIIDRLLTEAHVNTRLAVNLGHRTMSVLVHIEVLIDVVFDNHACQLHGQVILPAAHEDDQEEEEEEEVQDQFDMVPDEQPVQRLGLNEEEIMENLLVAPFSGQGPPERCIICLDDIARGSMAAWLFCGHAFHPDCISEWLRTNATCPVFRLDLI